MRACGGGVVLCVVSALGARYVVSVKACPRRRGDSPSLRRRSMADPDHLADQAARIAAALQTGG
ncbi:MAG: hypothetical protein OXU40_06970 [Nitrospira sp.]|nr:hypothetical protein [Nitrospira sp.]